MENDMTKKQQEYFADQFVRKDLRERVLHEMRKKPDRFEWRLCHDVLGMINEKAIVLGAINSTKRRRSRN